jgi:uncharacterized protein (TIGR00251 family)
MVSVGNMILTVHVKPNARENKLLSWLDETTVKVSVTAAPEKGKANEAVIALLSKELRIPKTTIELIRGATARMKQFSVPERNSQT